MAATVPHRDNDVDGDAGKKTTRAAVPDHQTLAVATAGVMSTHATAALVNVPLTLVCANVSPKPCAEPYPHPWERPMPNWDGAENPHQP